MAFSVTIDPKPTIGLAISKLRDHSIPEGDQFSCLGIADRSRSHRSVHRYQLRLRIHEDILSMNTQENTEDVCKIYAESFRDQSHLNRIQNEAKAAIAQVL